MRILETEQGFIQISPTPTPEISVPPRTQTFTLEPAPDRGFDLERAMGGPVTVIPEADSVLLLAAGLAALGLGLYRQRIVPKPSSEQLQPQFLPTEESPKNPDKPHPIH